MKDWLERGIWFVTPLDKEYPSASQPYSWISDGTLCAREASGSAPSGRSCRWGPGLSEYGSVLGETFGELLAKEQVQIISGLALGIDGANPPRALRAGADTYGVLGCGVNICYPSAHYKLYGQMLTRGGIISEFPLDTGPLKMNFLMRNRIISGLSDAIPVVVEAKERVVPLITGRAGPGSGKEIFAVPRADN